MASSRQILEMSGTELNASETELAFACIALIEVGSSHCINFQSASAFVLSFFQKQKSSLKVSQGQLEKSAAS